jgi:predicted alpha/beta hydrolase family esterase
MLCLNPKPTTLVLVGHSQGGAASAYACEERIVNSQNIKGLLLIASENPKSFDAMNWVPVVKNIQFIHAHGDQV